MSTNRLKINRRLYYKEIIKSVDFEEKRKKKKYCSLRKGTFVNLLEVL